MVMQIRRRRGRTLKNPGLWVAGGLARAAFRAGLRSAATGIRKIGMKRVAAATAAAGAAGTGYQVYKTRGPSGGTITKIIPNRKSRSVGTVTKMNKSSFGQHDIQPSIRMIRKIANGSKIPRSILKTGYNSRVLRWQGLRVLNSINPTTTYPGYFPLVHRTQGTSTICPMVMFCLNQTLNGSGTSYNPCQTLQIDDNGSLTFLAQNGQTTLLANSPNWQLDTETSNSVGIADPQTRYIMPSYYNIRLNCYGTNAQPTLFHIMVVSFTDSFLDPYESPSNAQEAADRQKMYQSMVQKFMSNPLLPTQFIKKKFKVYASTKFVLQPTLNVENDTTPQSKIVEMTLKDGQFYDYAYHGDGFTGVNADDRLSTVGWATQNVTANDYSQLPNTKARKFLIIRALNTTRVDFANETGNNTPSFDIIVRKKEYFSI